MHLMTMKYLVIFLCLYNFLFRAVEHSPSLFLKRENKLNSLGGGFNRWLDKGVQTELKPLKYGLKAVER